MKNLTRNEILIMKRRILKSITALSQLELYCDDKDQDDMMTQTLDMIATLESDLEDLMNLTPSN